MGDSAVQKKPGFFDRIKRFFKDIKGEIKKVVWPDKQRITNNTIIVIGVVLISAVFVGCFDIITSYLVQFFVNLL